MLRVLLTLVVLAGACVDLTPPAGTVTPLDGGGGKDGAGGDAEVMDGPQTGEDRPTASDGDAEPADGNALLEVGKRCSDASQCASGFCADGFCCSGACAGICQGCGLPGSEGACVTVPAGQDPREECAEEAVATCGGNGTCDGMGACARHAAGTECAPGSCTDATESAASTCDGNGLCRPGTSRSCAPRTCMAGSCASGCATEVDCQAGFFCEADRCVVRRANGASCTMAVQCASGQCVDGRCCNTTCTGRCHACNVAGKEGTCTPLPSPQDPQGECPAEASATCGRAGGCDGKGACRLHAAGVGCGAQTCSGNVESGPRSCNGAGVCQPNFIRACSPYACNGAACATTCSSATGCATGHYCSAGACVAFGAAPVLHWKFDEAAGTSALDSSGNGHTGTYIGNFGTPSASTMRPPVSFPNAFSRAFAASNRQAVTLAPAPAMIQPANNLTIALWYRTTTLDFGHDPPAASEAVTQNDNYFIRIRASDIAFTRRGGGSYISCFAVAPNHLDGNWHHVAAVLSPAGMKVYVDGVERCSNTRGENMNYDKGPDLFVGRHSSSGDWDVDGNLDDVRIYNRALPAGEVAALAAGL